VLLNESHHDITVDVPIDMDAKPEVIKETAETLRRVEKVAHDALHSH
jgi:propanediol dehydratase small subunit